jgi:hypothetical protein
MKSLLQEVRGCSGSFRLHTIEEYSTMREAAAEAKRRNTNIADRHGISLRKYLADRSNYEGQFIANRKVA